MKTIAVSEFKAHALQVLDNVAKNKESVIVTRRGRPLAEVVPFRGSVGKSLPGKLSDTLVFEKDILSPLGESQWDACK